MEAKAMPSGGNVRSQSVAAEATASTAERSEFRATPGSRAQEAAVVELVSDSAAETALPNPASPETWFIPVGPAPRTRRRVDKRQKEIESMTHWAFWTAIVGAVLLPFSFYSLWLLLTLAFERAKTSVGGRRRVITSWVVVVASLIGWYLFVQTRM
jgi:hypothetical protein